MQDSQANICFELKNPNNNKLRLEASIRRTERYETTKSGEHGEETGHHQTSHTATQDVQNC